MNKKIVISIIFLIIIILLFVVCSQDVYKTLECNGDVDLIGSHANQTYIFEGKNNYIEKQVLEVRLTANEESLAIEYYDNVKEDETCTDLTRKDNFVSYTCTFDLLKDHYYEDLEDENHRLRFDVIKKSFEEDNFICNYK